jgi:epoxyqueuosine reductase
MDRQKNAEIIKQLSQSYGFDFCGISEAGFLEEQAPRLEQWLKSGYQGEMQYLENHFDKRLDPRLLVPGAKTVVSLLYNYYPDKIQDTSTHQIAKYAYGEDYHMVVKDRCYALLQDLRQKIGDIDGRVFVDSAPVMERAWAEKSGLGWIGRHGLLINKTHGSFYFLAELIIDLDCATDGPIKDYCGTCTRCVDACPTDAILPDKTLNASQCISYLTIELKSAINEQFKDEMNDWIFGCDICQDVCPWNRFSSPNNEPRFSPVEAIAYSKQDWDNLEKEQFERIFKNSAIQRTGFSGLKRNISFLKRNSNHSLD